MLAGQLASLGVHRLLKAQVILPDEGWFPEDYEGTTEAARRSLGSPLRGHEDRPILDRTRSL